VSIGGQAKHRGERQTGLVKLLSEVNVKDAEAVSKGHVTDRSQLTLGGGPCRSTGFSPVRFIDHGAHLVADNRVLLGGDVSTKTRVLSEPLCADVAVLDGVLFLGDRVERLLVVGNLGLRFGHDLVLAVGGGLHRDGCWYRAKAPVWRVASGAGEAPRL
jgi:hypothetical protein